MEGAEDEDEAGEGRVGGDGLEPVVVDVEEQHLRLRRPGWVSWCDGGVVDCGIGQSSPSDGCRPALQQTTTSHMCITRQTRKNAPQDAVAELLHLEAGLEGQLQLRALDHHL